MLCLVDVESRKYRGKDVSNAELDQKQYALRVEAGCATDWAYVEVQGSRILFVSSATRGTIAYDWNFETVVGLWGPVSAVSVELVASDEEVLAVVGNIDASLVTILRRTLQDSLGKPVCPSPDQKCLTIAGRFSESETSTGLNFAHASRIELKDMSGLLSFDLLIQVDPSQQVGLCPFSLNSRKDSDSFTCPTNSTPTIMTRCIVFNVSLTSGSPAVFATDGLPFIDSEGSLNYKLSGQEVGQAKFAVDPLIYDVLLLKFIPIMQRNNSRLEIVITVDPSMLELTSKASQSNSNSFIAAVPDTSAVFLAVTELVLTESTKVYNRTGFLKRQAFHSIDPSFWFELYGVWSVHGEQVTNLLTLFTLNQNGDLFFCVNASNVGLFTVVVALQFTKESELGNIDSTWYSNFSLVIVPDRLEAEVDQSSANILGTIELPEDQIIVGAKMYFDRIFELGLVFSSIMHDVSFTFVNSTEDYLFSNLPTIFNNGTISIEFRSLHIGYVNLTVVLQHGPCKYFEVSCNSIPNIDYFVIILQISAVSIAPFFMSILQVLGIENSGPQVIYGAVYNIRTSSNESEHMQPQSFIFVVNYTSSVSDLFSEVPLIDSNGTLRFSCNNDKFGMASLAVQLLDIKNVLYQGQKTQNLFQNGPIRKIMIKIFPSPKVFSVAPNFGQQSGGNRITVTGMHFGSIYSRGYEADSYSNLSVYVCGSVCSNVMYVSDSRLSCVASRGIGTGGVYVNISDGFYSRGGFLPQGYTYTSMVLAGKKLLAGSYLLFGPQRFISDPSEYHSSTLQAISLPIFHSVYALAYYGGNLIVGGDIIQAGSVKVNNIFSWDGNYVTSLQNGLDGRVNAMTKYGPNIVVGGSFSFALRTEQATRVGGICVWNGTEWFTLGAYPLEGIVTALASSENQLYAAGQFGWIGPSEFRGLAVFNGTEWFSVGGGVEGGHVLCLALSSGRLVVGGNFEKAGGKLVWGLAFWDGSVWHSMGGVNGNVLDIAMDERTIYVAGAFTEAGGKSAKGLALYKDGRLDSLGSTVNGTPRSLFLSGSCLLVGSDFNYGYDPRNLKKKSFLVQWCQDSSLESDVYTTFELPDTSGAIHAMLLI
uniref:IPT/TIG domain-containing protein n=1 Tax=Cryptomonas curvata TaxID=233186 RepID=A0A7S0MQ56_9CRYP